MGRGTIEFEVISDGHLVNSASNVEKLRRLWLDRSVIDGDDLGDGDPGDFDNGAWHSACHLIAAGGIRRAGDGRLWWLEIAHERGCDEYRAIAVSATADGAVVLPLDSADGRSLLAGSTLLGFVEGNSLGRTSARGVIDPPDRFNLWRRQDFDQPINSTGDGGKVWEHWCTTRDIRASSRIGTSVLSAYVSLTAALGDLFPAVVARGRRDYGHPKQLCAMIAAGFVAEASATRDITPAAIPQELEPPFLQAEPSQVARAVEQLDWSDPPRYYMFLRRIDRWCGLAEIQNEQTALRARKPN